MDVTARAQAAHRWLAAEIDVEAADETVDTLFLPLRRLCVESLREAAVGSTTPHLKEPRSALKTNAFTIKYSRRADPTESTVHGPTFWVEQLLATLSNDPLT